MTLGVAPLMDSQADSITDYAVLCMCVHVFVLLFSITAFKKLTDCVD